MESFSAPLAHDARLPRYHTVRDILSGEIAAHKWRPEEALRAAWGTLVGLMGGVVAKVLVHLAMGVLVLRAIF